MLRQMFLILSVLALVVFGGAPGAAEPAGTGVNPAPVGEVSLATDGNAEGMEEPRDGSLCTELIRRPASYGIGIDMDGNVWVGGRGNNAFDLLDGFTGEIVRDDQDQERTFNIGTGGYGGLIDCNGVFWSVSKSGNIGLFRYNTARDIYDPDCCEADILTDSNNDGVIDGEDELVEDVEALTFPVNSDDDNLNDISDFEDDGPVYGEDDLQEVKLFVSCYIDDPTAWWSLSWTDPDPDGDPDTPTIRIWRQPDKSDGEEPPGPGEEIDNGVHYTEWPPPRSLWLEALQTFQQIHLSFTVSDGRHRWTWYDGGYLRASCTPRPYYWAGYKRDQSFTGVQAKIMTRDTWPLCGEIYPLPQRVNALSAAWVGMHHNHIPPVGAPFKLWAQFGYLAHYIKGDPVVLRQVYSESVWGPDPANDRQIRFHGPPESGSHMYTVAMFFPGNYLISYEYEGALLDVFSHELWDGAAHGISLLGEVYNREDKLSGTDSLRCQFIDIKTWDSWQGPDPWYVMPMDLKYYPEDDPWVQAHAQDEWGMNTPGITDFFEIWDKKPQQPAP